jgi:hypothetical protein
MTSPDRPSLDELAAGRLDADDLDVLARTARLFDTLDPVPAGLVERIQFGLTLDALQAEIAQLQRSGEPAGVRSASSEAQSVTFTSATLTTMITITPTTVERVRIDGWIAPGAGVAVELRIDGQSRATTADADGRFVIDDVARGLAQFVLRPPGDGSRPVVTPALEI